jgi:hypothetical protein
MLAEAEARKSELRAAIAALTASPQAAPEGGETVQPFCWIVPSLLDFVPRWKGQINLDASTHYGTKHTVPLYASPQVQGGEADDHDCSMQCRYFRLHKSHRKDWPPQRAPGVTEAAAAAAWVAMGDENYLFGAGPFEDAHPDDQAAARRIAAAVLAAWPSSPQVDARLRDALRCVLDIGSRRLLLPSEMTHWEALLAETAALAARVSAVGVDGDESDALLPCPFCGGEPKLTEVEPSGYVVECTNGICNASTNIRYSCGDDARPLVKEQWNRRRAALASGPSGVDEAAAVRGAWRAAITLGNNICVQESDRHNDNDETEGANTGSECAKRIRQYVEPSDEALAELLNEAGARDAAAALAAALAAQDQGEGNAR